MTERVVVLQPGGVFDATELTELSAVADVTVVCRSGMPSAGLRVVELAVPQPKGPVRSLIRAAERSPVGRTLVRLTPWDEGSAFWRAARRDAAVSALLRDALVVAAGERDGIYAAWRARRAAKGLRAVFGIAAAREAVSA